MQLISRIISVTLIAFALFPASSFAQFQLNVMGSRAISTAKGSSISDGAWGAGATLRYFTSPRIAVGLNTRYYKNRYMYSFGTLSSTSQNTNIIATGQVDYFFPTKSALQPYAGFEAGVLHSRYETESVRGYTTDRYLSTQSYLLVGPRAGVQYAVTRAIGLNVEASYQFIVDRNYTEPVLFVNAGGFVKFGNR